MTSTSPAEATCLMPFGNTKRGGSRAAWRVKPRCGPRAIATLCDAMSDRESLVAPDYVMDDCREVKEAMASEAVIYIQDSNVRFFHEAFFDYAFARTFLRANSDLVQWLTSDEQHLFRRSQVRQVLAFLRDREPDRARYLSTLKGLLGHAEVRFHIKKLVLDWLGALPDPTREEWEIVEGLTEQLGGHAWGVVHNSVPWFDVLQDMGRWQSWLTADEQQVDRAVTLLRLPEVLGSRSAAVAALVDPFPRPVRRVAKSTAVAGCRWFRLHRPRNGSPRIGAHCRRDARRCEPRSCDE